MKYSQSQISGYALISDLVVLLGSDIFCHVLKRSLDVPREPFLFVNWLPVLSYLVGRWGLDEGDGISSPDLAALYKPVQV
jgi:hypothetical protein